MVKTADPAASPAAGVPQFNFMADGSQFDTMNPINLLRAASVLAIVLWMADGSTLSAQEKPPATPPSPGADKRDQEPETATLRGKLVVPAQYAQFLQPGEMVLKLSEQVAMDEPPVPAGFDSMDPEKQMAWWQEFQNSEAGKKFVAEQETRFRNRRVLDIRVEPTGEFTAYDVPRGIWDLRSAVSKQAGKYEVLFEIFGELVVEPQVQEIALGDMEIVATTMLRAGDELPPLRLAGNAGTVDIAAAKGTHCLLTFWSAGEASSSFFQKTVQEALAGISPQHPLTLYSIGLNQDPEALRAFLAENGNHGVHADTTWDDELLNAIGVRSIPWLMLLDRDGKVLASDRDLGTALRTSGLGLQEILLRKIEGREIPVPPPPGSGGSNPPPAGSGG